MVEHEHHVYRAMVLLKIIGFAKVIVSTNATAKKQLWLFKRELKNDDIHIAEVIIILFGFDLNLMSYRFPTPQRLRGTVVPHCMEPVPAQILMSAPTQEHVLFVHSMKPVVPEVPGAILPPDNTGSAVAQQFVPMQELPEPAVAPQPVHPILPPPAVPEEVVPQPVRAPGMPVVQDAAPVDASQGTRQSQRIQNRVLFLPPANRRRLQ